MKYVVAYDICDPKRLSKVAKYLEQIGIRIQNSVFEIDNQYLLISITDLFNEIVELCEDEDKVFIYKIKNKQDLQLDTNNWEMVF
jgi:CRISPR-associated endonuclease Cas2